MLSRWFDSRKRGERLLAWEEFSREWFINARCRCVEGCEWRVISIYLEKNPLFVVTDGLLFGGGGNGCMALA